MTSDITDIWTGFHQELKAFIRNKVRNQADAEDILQDVFVKILSNSARVSQARHLQQYIYGIVRNAIADYFRKKKNTHAFADASAELTAEESDTLNASVAECCIKPFINKLPPHYREALLLTEIQNMPQKELASRLGISYSGAKSRVQRGKEKLKDYILNCCAYESDSYGNLSGKKEDNCACS